MLLNTPFLIPIDFATTTAILVPQDPTTSDKPAPVGGSTPGGGAPAPGSIQQPDPNAKPQAAPCAGNEMLWFMPVMLGLLYFMMIRPEQKRRKEQQSLLSSVKQGDKVVTISGMHGVISRLSEKTVTLRVDNAEITFDRTSIARIERDGAANVAKS